MPYESDAQRRWAHTEEGKKALGGEEAVNEWDKESEGLDLPEKKKDEKEVEKSMEQENLTFTSLYDLNKSVDKSKLVQVPVQVTNDKGKSFTRNQWKKIDEDKQTSKVVGTGPEVDKIQSLQNKYGGSVQLIAEMKKQGISWDEHDNHNINNMRAKMALKKFFKDGGEWKEVQGGETTKEPTKPIEKFYVTKLGDEGSGFKITKPEEVAKKQEEPVKPVVPKYVPIVSQEDQKSKEEAAAATVTNTEASKFIGKTFYSSYHKMEGTIIKEYSSGLLKLELTDGSTAVVASTDLKPTVKELPKDDRSYKHIYIDENDVLTKDHDKSTVKADFQEFLLNLIHMIAAKAEMYYRNFPSQGERLSIQEGPRYVRIVKHDGWVKDLSDPKTLERGSVWGFIDKKNGDIYYPAGWKGPNTKTPVRGNIFMHPDELNKWVGHHGPANLR